MLLELKMECIWGSFLALCSGHLRYSSLLQSSASDESCALVRSVLQEYEVILQLYIALTYTVNDAVKLNNYYNSPA